MRSRRKLPLYSVLFLICGILPAFAGQASLSGPARCTMPDHLEMQAPSFGQQAPAAAVASLPAQSRQDERATGPQEEVMVAESATSDAQKTVVNTVYAK